MILLMSMSWLAFGFWVMCGCGVGIILGFRFTEVENLTKEEYAHCVQIILSDYDKGKSDVQTLLTELQGFAMDNKQRFDALSMDAQRLVNRVRYILSQKG